MWLHFFRGPSQTSHEVLRVTFWKGFICHSRIPAVIEKGQIVSRMHRIIAAAFVCLVIGTMIAAAFWPRKVPSFDGPFVIADGETLVTNGQRLQLKGLDSPEIGQRCRGEDGVVQLCGAQARFGLAQRMAQAGVLCQGSDRIDNDRILVTCNVMGRDVGAEMVRSGLVLNAGGYENEEKQAQADKVGLWAGAFDRPEEWRRLHPRNDIIRRQDEN